MTHKNRQMHAEANMFALEILIPFEFIIKDGRGVDIADDEAVKRLADKYKVPAAVMALRLGQVAAAREVKP